MRILFLLFLVACTTNQEEHHCDPDDLWTFDGDVHVGNSQTEGFESYRCVVEITGELFVQQNDQLTSLDVLSNLTTIGKGLSLREDPGLRNLDGLRSLTTVGQFITVEGNENLENVLGLGALASVGEALDSVSVGLSIVGNPRLTSLQGLDSLTTITINGTLWIAASELEDLSGMPALQTVRYVQLDDNPELTDISQVGAFGMSTLVVSNNAALTRIDVAAAAGLTDVEITDNPALESARIQAGSARPSILVEENPQLQSVAIEGTDAVDALYLLANPALSSLSAPGLQAVNRSIYIDGAVLPSLDGLDALGSIGGDLDVVNCSLLQTMELPSLTAVGGHVSLRWNSSLQGLSGLDGLIQIGGDLSVHHNATLDNLGLASLSTVHGDFEIYDNAALCGAQVDDLLAQLSSTPISVTNSGNTGACP